MREQNKTVSATSEAELIARAQQGDGVAFQGLFEAHKARVYSLCLRMTHNPSDADDLTQETFLRLFRKISTYRGESAFSTWLHRLVVNVVLMELRKKRHPQVALDDTDPSQGRPVRREPGDHDQRLTGLIDRIVLERVISDLPPGYRAVFVLHDVQGCEHEEIARMLSCSVGNSQSQLHKARLKLRRWLGKGRLRPSRRAKAGIATTGCGIGPLQNAQALIDSRQLQLSAAWAHD